MLRPHAVTKGKGVCIIEWLHLAFSTHTFINCLNTWIYGVKPSSLNICLLLRIIGLGVDLTCQITDQLQTLIVEGSCLTTSIFVIGRLEFLSYLYSCFWSNCTEMILIS